MIDEPASVTLKDADETCQSDADVYPVACVSTTAVVPATLMLGADSCASILVFPLFVPLWLPVVAGDLALLSWSEKLAVFRPSLLLRLLILTLIMEGCYHINHYVNPPAKPPYSTINEETMNQVVIMSLWGGSVCAAADSRAGTALVAA